MGFVVGNALVRGAHPDPPSQESSAAGTGPRSGTWCVRAGRNSLNIRNLTGSRCRRQRSRRRVGARGGPNVGPVAGWPSPPRPQSQPAAHQFWRNGLTLTVITYERAALRSTRHGSPHQWAWNTGFPELVSSETEKSETENWEKVASEGHRMVVTLRHQA